MKTLFKNGTYIALFLIINLDLLSCNLLKNNLKSFTDDEEITTIYADDQFEFVDAIDQLSKKGGTIYIDTPIINLNTKTSISITGQIPGGIIGIRQSNGEYPQIKFTHEREEVFMSGLNIFGSNKFIEYIIIENSPSYGVSVFGDNNILDHVISRYNLLSGFNVFGNFNTFNYCYSYRNFNVNYLQINSDGFHISGELNNVFNYCFAWDNGNSGFNYVRLFNSSELSYLHSGSWNNGNINVFTGRYDYDNGNPLDKNLFTIQQIMENDPSFVSNYYNNKYSIDGSYMYGITVKEWISEISPRLEGNGFTFGKGNSSQSIDVKRNALYCASFDHKAGGFIDNFNHRYNAFITNCAAFNNGINYKLPYTFSRWSNNWSWGSKNNDQLNEGISTNKPSNVNRGQRLLYTVRDQISQAVSANMFPDGVNFDSAILENPRIIKKIPELSSKFKNYI